MADNDLKREYKPDESDVRPSLLLQYREKARLSHTLLPSGPGCGEAQDPDTYAKQIAERKALLKAQYEMLKAKGY